MPGPGRHTDGSCPCPAAGPAYLPKSSPDAQARERLQGKPHAQAPSAHSLTPARPGLQVWDVNTGQGYTSIEPGNGDINDVCVWPESGEAAAHANPSPPPPHTHALVAQYCRPGAQARAGNGRCTGAKGWSRGSAAGAGCPRHPHPHPNPCAMLLPPPFAALWHVWQAYSACMGQLGRRLSTPTCMLGPLPFLCQLWQGHGGTCWGGSTVQAWPPQFRLVLR